MVDFGIELYEATSLESTSIPIDAVLKFNNQKIT